MAPDTETRLLARPLNWLETRSEATFAYVLLAPAFALLALIAFYPLIETFRFSLLADETASRNPFGGFVGFDNYAALLSGDALIPQQFLDPTFSTPVLQQALFVTLMMANASVTNSACWSTGVENVGSRNCWGISASPDSNAA